MSNWVVYAVIAMLCFGIANFILKYATSRELSPLHTSALMMMTAGIIAIVLLARLGFSIVIANPRAFLLIAIAAALNLVGAALTCIALSKGKAGPVIAIASANFVIVAILSYLLLKEGLSTTQILAIALFMIALILLILK